MELKLYKTEDGENVINKVYTDELLLNIRLRRDTDIDAPEIVLSRDAVVDYLDYDAAYLPDLDRWYFIRRVVKGAVITIMLEIDYLETYKDKILAADATYMRKAVAGDYGEISLSETGEVEYTYVSSDVALEEDDGTLFSVIGV